MSILKQVQERRALNENKEVLSEGVRLVATHHSDSGKHTAKVYRDSEYGEHKVKFHINGKHHEPSDYHTDSVEDAHGTARHQLKALDKLHGALKEDFEETSDLTEEQIEEMLDTLTIEEFEQLDEISKKTLSSYVSAARMDAAMAVNMHNQHKDRANNAGTPATAKKNTKLADHHMNRLVKRDAGIRMATKKLAEETELSEIEEAFIDTITEEEFEQLDELSKGLLSRYADKNADGWDERTHDRDVKGKKWTKTLQRTHDKRHKGEKMAGDKLSGRAKVNATEEVEPRGLKSIVGEAFNKGGRPKKKRDLQGNTTDEA